MHKWLSFIFPTVICERCLWLKRIGIALAVVETGEKMGKGGISVIKTVISHHSPGNLCSGKTQFFEVSKFGILSSRCTCHSLCLEHLVPNSLLQNLYLSLTQASSFWNPSLSISCWGVRLSSCSHSTRWGYLTKHPTLHRPLPICPRLLVCVIFATGSDLLLAPEQLVRGLALKKYINS